MRAEVNIATKQNKKFRESNKKHSDLREYCGN